MWRRWVAWLGAGLALLGIAPASAAAADLHDVTFTDGHARFQVLSPTLVRLEYAADGAFEDRPTLTAWDRSTRTSALSSELVDGERVIRTPKLELRYKLGSGPFGSGNLRLAVEVGGQRRWVEPAFPPPPGWPTMTEPPFVNPPISGPPPAPRRRGNLGGWYRALDSQAGAIPLHDGILSRQGWYVLDDSESPLLSDDRSWYEPRPPHAGAYRDGYLFAYGDDYARGLRDFRRLAGPAPLLPRKAFGNWFSRYQAYSQREYRRLLGRFRSHRVPLDVLVVDTDFKSPDDWNGWQWTPALFPRPRAFVEWAHRNGLDLILNVHPSIATDDPAYAAANARAGGLITETDRCRRFLDDETASCGVWDWARPAHVESYFALHRPFEAIGVDSWWLDWCCDESRAEAPGLTPDAWINSLYAQRQRAQGTRWLPLARIGSSFWDYGAALPGVWAEHRNTIHFTGDTRATWEMLGFQAAFTAAEGAGIGHPYISHDVGSFLGGRLHSEMYVRWIQLGVFQPILRLHSNHAPRLPWEYGGRAGRIAAEFMRLRHSLIPYVYTVAREAYDTGMPIARPMYLEWPRAARAYRFPRQYMLGSELLVAPVDRPGDPARKRIWFPPGTWIDIFSGRRHRGPKVRTLSFDLEQAPVFARAGGIVPRQASIKHARRGAVDPLLVDVYAGAGGAFTLYEDSGEGFAYERGKFARVPLRWEQSGGRATLSVGRARGAYPVGSRRYRFVITGVGRPTRVRVGGGRLGRAAYEADRRRLTIETGPIATRGTAVRITFHR